MNRFATRFAASTMVIATAMVGCHSDSMMSSAIASTAERSAEQAERFAGQARAAAQNGDVARAVGLAERAVELSPSDLGYRMLLADLYLRNGRFRSAESSYGDVLSLEPANVRAGISVALAQIAQGRSSDALVQLEQISGNAPASDVGLAFALAGQPQRAIELLEPAARAADADGRTRQNLALAHAFAGDWQRARTVAAQDVAPNELGARLQHWASLARPSAPHSAVATLLGVTPVEDPGQPIRLALNRPAPQAPAFAEAAPAAATEQFAAAPPEAPAEAAEVPVFVPVQEPIQYAEAPVVQAAAPVVPAAAPVVPAAAPAAPVEAPVQSASWWPAPAVEAPAEAPAAPQTAEPVSIASVATVVPAADRYVQAVRTLAAPSPVLRRASVSVARTNRPVFRPAVVNRLAAVTALIPRAGTSGRFVVQLGAFSNPQNAERAWAQAESRFGLGGAEARTATININGRTLHRVSIAGFTNRLDAVRVCASIQSRGGSCFVRANAGDVPVRWASRSSRARRA